jgi:RNA polymerase sigma factor (sigma-70 family)
MNEIDPDDVRAIGRDPDAFEAFYRAHIESIGRFIARRVDDPQLVADLTSQIFLTAVEVAETYRPEKGTPAGWLFGIAKNVLVDHIRKQARERKAHRLLAGRRFLEPDALARIEERIDAERSMRLLFHTLEKLPKRDRRLLELVAVDGLTVADAAAVLGMKPGTARVRLHRSRARFDQLISSTESPSSLRPLEAT